MKKIIKKIIEILNTLIKTRRFFYYIPGKYSSFGNTAVKTEFGFWYVGNVLDQKDIACGILNYGIIEEDETKIVLLIYEYFKNKDFFTMLDIGANTGYYGLLAANFFDKNVGIFSFEPIKEYADCLNESIRLNRFEDRVKTFNYALSSNAGLSKISIDGTCSSMEQEINTRQDVPSREIVTKKLDTVASELNITPDFIKIDVEGHELETLKGGAALLEKTKPVLFVEIIQTISDWKWVNDDYQKTLDFISKIGYKSYSLKDGELKEVSNDTLVDGVCMYLFLHPQKHSELSNRLLKHAE